MHIGPRTAAIVWIVLLLVLASGETSDTGTTKGFDKIVVGRCLDYNSTKYVDILPRVITDCKQIWQKFKAAFAYKDPCNVSISDYDKLVGKTLQELPQNKIMLWSGLFAFAHRFSDRGQRFVTLEDTLLGFLADSLQWCGQITNPGINYTKCPSWKSCPLEASESFWGAASKMLASNAKGKVTIMLDGSNPNRSAYRRNSFFAKYELPNLNVNKVPSLNVLLVHRLDKPVKEKCNTGSLVELANDVKKRGLKFTCEDNPSAVHFLLCADIIDGIHCDIARRHMRGWLPEPQEKTYFNRKPYF